MSPEINHRYWLFGLALTVFATPLSAQWRDNGKPVADTEWRKAWGHFGGMLELTDKPDELFAEWRKQGAGVPIHTVAAAKRGAPIVAVVIFSGCTPNSAGLCDSDATFQVFKPDGSAYGGEEKAELWTGKAPPAQGELQLSVGAMGVRIEPQDPNGMYSVRVRIVDNVSHAKAELRRSFRVDP